LAAHHLHGLGVGGGGDKWAVQMAGRAGKLSTKFATIIANFTGPRMTELRQQQQQQQQQQQLSDKNQKTIRL